MSARAALPMYDWPELREQVDAFYAQLRGLVPDLPETLTRVQTEAQLHALWHAPDLVLAQTCWGPLQSGLDAHVHVLAQPHYDDVPGGRGTRYRSALVMRAGQHCAAPLSDGACLPQGLAKLRPAINAPDSMSGCLALMQDMDAPNLAQGAYVTGSHRASIRAVADGRADFAAIDCRSWAYALSHEPAAATLIVTGWTALRPGLPFITSRQTPTALRTRLAKALVQLGAAPA
ncbi:phosphate/phosphite/phosphonate ABC transporter substrate-binding protein [Roseinatronobacter monicus]|uniref:Phosphonate ABC transporter substrate-binding protein n=1 Tax=Roseinatronobacter monicus TaxID=393481 RepID=A0A543KHQ1_9RHOB|nr:PhnD/SsuA/transferrin family substrate-binding protein [Roseinatronobacter monicus]TQM94594.1 phosphonate ABC transporter substrate-binding protein [Roseinatronobacter monicus]